MYVFVALQFEKFLIGFGSENEKEMKRRGTRQQEFVVVESLENIW